jgi:phosphomannomutase
LKFTLQYPTCILEGKYPIRSVRDLTTGYDNTQPGNRAVLPVSNSSQMITFTFKNGLVTTLRTSGTEPKIKYYNELCASPDQK